MAWEQLSINKPHLVYIILGAFTSLFMLCSSLIKERLYIGEATVATLCGVIFGPHAANLIDPGTWGNTDQITLEFSRIVLVVQCFAVGVELPKAYMERHWRSVVFLLVPVMTFGWLITSLFIWAFFIGHLNWLDSLCIAACVTATDPVLASSVVGKGKFAKRVPKHLRDLLSAESGCNDGMAFPFVYLALYIIRYYGHPDEVSLHWFCITILYECVFGAVYGVAIGYIARRLIRYAHEHNLIDRESFLVYYFVLALFCAGSGSLLGMDDLLIGFACGVGFSNDGWFTHETEQSHVSNVIDLLINLAFFVYFGTIIPWQQYNSGILGLEVWKLVVIAILVLLFRRIPIMMALKPFIPDIKTWREALFAGHFGPIGVGAIFVAILARAELETGETTPLADLPPPDFEHDNIIELIWPITTFLVICSILVHGSSIAVFTLGKHINTLTLTMSYTKDNDGGNWMDRLPRIQSRSKSQASSRADDSDMDEKEKRLSPSDLTPGTFLRRQREDDGKGRSSRNSSRHRSRRSRNWDNGIGPGGPVSESAIRPARRQEEEKPQSISRSDSETLAAKSESPSKEKDTPGDSDPQSPGEIYEEGDDTVYEDEEGNVLAVEPTHEHNEKNREHDEVDEGKRLMRKESANKEGVATKKDDPNHDTADEVKDKVAGVENEAEEHPERPGRQWISGLSKLTGMNTLRKHADSDSKPEKPKETRGPARAYQYGNTIIVEDEDGEVIKKFDIPAPSRNTGADSDRAKHRIGRMGKMLGLGSEDVDEAVASAAGPSEDKPKRPAAHGMRSSRRNAEPDPNDERLRFTVGTDGRRLSTAEFIHHISKADPKTRADIVENSTAPEEVKREARKEVREQAALKRSNTASANVPVVHEDAEEEVGDIRGSDDDLKLVDDEHEDVPFHDVSSELAKRNLQEGETAAARRRRLAMQRKDDSDDDGTERQPPRGRGPVASLNRNDSDTAETAAERRRRLGALGKSKDQDSDSEEEQPRRGIRFDEPARPGPSEKDTNKPRGSMLRWGENRKSG
ncbi:hypothetical protein AMS68_000150 [Peltaster fructicola]|uniref:Na(+)/H(+) antiporter n=1 Tax=Peltaster fructicola TaxID=286661 RepID=A0A6H0XIS9_9PEZI|nr:hypothetical protein AMS68_000150 [Peltaster fructicola]